MAYRVIKDGEITGSFPKVSVSHGGTLVCSDIVDGVDLILAAGQWDSVFWEDEE